MGANHAITEPATWDNDPPIVPDLDADMDDATSVIEAFVTKLGKRTQWLKAAIAAIPPPPVLTDYARKSVANVFSAANTFTAAIETRDVNVRGGGNVDVDGTVHADGAITSDGDMSARDFNATRDVNAQRNVNAGNGNVSAKLVHADTDFTGDRDAIIDRNIRATHGDIRANEGQIRGVTVVSDSTVDGAEYRYPSGSVGGIIRNTELNISVSGDAWFVTEEGFLLARESDSARIIPIHLPTGALLQFVSILYGQHSEGEGDAVDSFELMDCPTPGDFNDIPTVALPGPYISTTSSGGGTKSSVILVRTIVRGMSGHSSDEGLYINNAGATYKLKWNAAHPVELLSQRSIGSLLYRVQLTWVDPGPRNH